MVEIRSYQGPISDEVLQWMSAVSLSVFGHGSVADYRDCLEGRRDIWVGLAFDGVEPVGFKVGYRERPRYFESWRGGVLEKARRRGIAAALMEAQHTWALSKGFLFVSTTTAHDNTGMIMLNLRDGFQVVGSFLDRGRHLKLLLQKQIAEPPESLS